MRKANNFLIGLSFGDKIWKNSKLIAFSVLVFWLLIVSINARKIFNITDYVADESTNLSTSKGSESQIGNNILSEFSELNSTFQIVVHNPEGSILTNDVKLTITQLINNITYNPKLGPYLSAKNPYSSVFDDADNMLRSVLSLQWFSTQMAFASTHFIWGGVEYFSTEWVDRYNLTNDVELSTSIAEQNTHNFILQYLDDNNESRYENYATSFIESLAESFSYHANLTPPTNTSEAYSLSQNIIVTNSSFFDELVDDPSQLKLLTTIADNFNGLMWEDDEYLYSELSNFLFNSSDASSVNFIKEVYSDGDIEGFVKAKNKYLLPVLRKEVEIPPLSKEIVDTFLLRYTNYRNENDTVDTTLISFNLAINHNTEKGKEAYIELMDIVPLLQERYKPLEIFITGLDLFIVELSTDYENQINRNDIIIIITIIVILILVYRSPILPLIQLFVLAIAFGVSRLMFVFIGIRMGGLASTSLLVLSICLLGATTDYCVFLMGDYLYNLKKNKIKDVALKATFKRTLKSIVISSLSLTIGFGSLILSNYPMTRGMGIGGTIGFLTSMIVSLTLIPSILVLINEKYLLKWKFTFKKLKLPSFSIRNVLKKTVQKRKIVLIVAILLAVLGTGIFLILPTDYAQISTAPESYHSRQGLDAVNLHMGTEYISQITLLFQTPDSDSFLQTNGSLNLISIQHVLAITEEVKEAANISFVIGLSHPLVYTYQESISNSSLFVQEEIYTLMKKFVLPDATLGVVYLGSQYKEGDDRLNNQIASIRENLQTQLEERNLSMWEVYTTGVASRIYDTIEGIRGDFNKILIFTSLSITALLIIFLRKVLMSFRVLITILISLGLSLGVFAIFNLIFFNGSVYWIVPLMLYAVLTALGLDFDVLFLGVFVDISKRTNNKEEAIVDAVDQTMSNISVAGIIMAATFLSLMFTSSVHMQQLGLGLGIGILIDVFVSRIFIVPPAIVLTFKQPKNKKEEDNEEEGEND